MKARMLNIGSRLVAASTSTTDALQGTQHLLTAAGRSALISHYRDSYDAGAHAVTTAINAAPAFLDKAEFFSDFDRDNDLSFYEVGKATTFSLQGNGCAPPLNRFFVALSMPVCATHA